MASYSSDTLPTHIEYHSANLYYTYTMYNPVDIRWEVLNDIMSLYYLHIYHIFGLKGLHDGLLEGALRWMWGCFFTNIVSCCPPLAPHFSIPPPNNQTLAYTTKVSFFPLHFNKFLEENLSKSPSFSQLLPVVIPSWYHTVSSVAIIQEVK